MFFEMVLDRNMRLHPRYLGASWRDHLVAQLLKEVEGRPSGRLGIVVAVTGIRRIGKGRIEEENGHVAFLVKYECIVCNCFRGEILEGVVTQIAKFGFVVECGPISVFVSKHNMPADLEYQALAQPPNFASFHRSITIQNDTAVRLRILGTKLDATQISCVADIAGDYLGAVPDS